MANELITITREEFLTYSGRDLSIELPSNDRDTDKVVTTINLWTNRVYDEIFVRFDKYDSKNFSERQKQAIKRAICDYGMYYLTSGDLYRESGYSLENGSNVSQSELENMRFPNYIKENLRRIGLRIRNLSYGYNPHCQDKDCF
jgi:hypothetical protein